MLATGKNAVSNLFNHGETEDMESHGETLRVSLCTSCLRGLFFQSEGLPIKRSPGGFRGSCKTVQIGIRILFLCDIKFAEDRFYRIIDLFGSKILAVHLVSSPTLPYGFFSF